jgi:hypothetical protein
VLALSSGKPEAAELVAAECVILAETKAKALKEAHKKVEDEEDEHMYHTMGWSRELWIESLGMPAMIPPPEEEKDVKTAIGAVRAKGKEML